mmetsp:Transcript_1905/g.5585  ORF Transcript_1905/g.5585 Transcript_1905/m.5585 type:complete len:133 (-) Transcript_1905:480-878(-)
MGALALLLSVGLAQTAAGFALGPRLAQAGRHRPAPLLRVSQGADFEDVYYEECAFYADATACAMETVIDVTTQDQLDFILAHAGGADPLSDTQKPHKLVVIMAHATWCRKCKYMIKQYLKLGPSHPNPSPNP